MVERLREVPRRTALFYGFLVVLVLVVAGFAAVSIVGTGSSSASGTQRTATVTRGTVESSVAGSGNISSADPASVGFTTSGTLTSVRVAVGDKVVKGQVLATIDATDAATNLASARATLATARSNLANAEAGGTASQRSQNQSSLASARLQLQSAEQTQSDDEATLAAAQAQLAADKRLNCIAPSSGSSNAAASSANSGSTGGSAPSSGSSTTARTTQAVAATTAPTVVTGSASASMPTTATLTGTVTPGGTSTSYWFQYGTSAGYGQQTAAATVSGTSAVSVSRVVSGLKQDTTYAYRLVARNSHGTRYGAALTFTTAATACSADQASVTAAERALATQRLTVQQQQQSVTSAESAITSAVDPTTVQQDRVQVAQDAIAVANAVKALKATRLLAPIPGTVTAVNGAVGDTVGSSSASNSSASSSSSSSSSTGGGGGGGGGNSNGTNGSSSSTSASSSSLVTIENMKKLQVVAGFPEADAVKIKVGQTASVTLSALSNVDMSGKVTAVSPTSTVVTNVVTYDVTIALRTRRRPSRAA